MYECCRNNRVLLKMYFACEMNEQVLHIESNENRELKLPSRSRKVKLNKI